MFHLNRMGLGLRLTLWYAVSLSVIIGACSVLIYTSVSQALIEELDHELREHSELIGHNNQINFEECRELVAIGEVPYVDIRINGKTVFTSPAWKSADLNASWNEPENSESWLILPPGERWFRILHINNGISEIALAVDADTVKTAIQSLQFILMTVLPLALCLSLGCGFFLTRRTLSPLAAMVHHARQITAEKLSTRLVVQNAQDELGQLAIVFNETLDRLEKSFLGLQRFTADASHELRSPLMTLRCVGEVALQQGPHTVDYRDTIGSMLEEVDRLSRLVDRLLLLSRADAGSIPLDMDALNLYDLMNDVILQLQPLAQEKNQTIKLQNTDSIKVQVDREFFRLALSNLLDNAIQYSPEKTNIAISIHEEGSFAVLILADQGPGVPLKHRDHIFDRFYRVDAARTQQKSNSGLGLGIVRWVVEAHKGRIVLECPETGGATFKITLPFC